MMYDELIRQMMACCKGMPCKDANCGFNPKSNLDCIEQLLTRAVDAIEDLENRLNLWQQDKIRRWIPVTERLPEYGEKCLVHFKLTGHNNFYISVSYCYVQHEGFWSDCGRDYKVTHWMPLPQPPKDGE